MDTKSKNSKYERSLNSPQGMWYSISWVACVAATVLSGIGATILAAFWTMEDRRRYADDWGFYDENNNWVAYEDRWSGTIHSADGGSLENELMMCGVAVLVLVLVALAFLIVLMVMTGRFDRERGEDGVLRIHLNWFDRIWSELHLVVGIMAGVLFVVAMIPLYEIWACENWFGVFVPNIYDEELFGIPNKLVIVLLSVGGTMAAVVTWACLISLVKKLKARKFWEKSLVGSIWLWLYRGVKGSDRTTFKVLIYLLLVCFCAWMCGLTLGGYFWWYAPWGLIFLALTLALIFLVAPKQIKKYREIRKGVAQVRRGNLAYQIPVQPGRSGALGELDRLAQEINGISEAQSIAVQNELKNQRMKTELISNVSHDLKTPLTSMMAYVDLLKKEGLDSPNAPEYLAIIDSKTQRLKVLTENLFEAAKASSGAIPVTISDIDLMALMNQSLAEMEGKLSERDLTVIVKNQCGEGCRVMADGQLLWRVIENLLGNVSKYALENSRVYINLSRLKSERAGRPSKIIMEIKNISKDELNISAEELMERFKRGDESRNTEGSGLGLAIARDLVHLMKGTFELTIDGDLFKACVVLDEAGASPGAAGSGAVNAGAASADAANAGTAGADIAAAGAEYSSILNTGDEEMTDQLPSGDSDGSADGRGWKAVTSTVAEDARAAGSAIGGAARKVGDSIGNLMHRHKAEQEVPAGEDGQHTSEDHPVD